jgi:hypothetical protein
MKFRDITDAITDRLFQRDESDKKVRDARRNATPEQRQAAITKYRDAAYNIEHGIGVYHEESDRLIKAQYEGLPSRYLLPGWLGRWSSQPDPERDWGSAEAIARRDKYLAFEQ